MASALWAYERPKRRGNEKGRPTKNVQMNVAAAAAAAGGSALTAWLLCMKAAREGPAQRAIRMLRTRRARQKPGRLPHHLMKLAGAIRANKGKGGATATKALANEDYEAPVDNVGSESCM